MYNSKFLEGITYTRGEGHFTCQTCTRRLQNVFVQIFSFPPPRFSFTLVFFAARAQHRFFSSRHFSERCFSFIWGLELFPKRLLSPLRENLKLVCSLTIFDWSTSRRSLPALSLCLFSLFFSSSKPNAQTRQVTKVDTRLGESFVESSA